MKTHLAAVFLLTLVASTAVAEITVAVTDFEDLSGKYLDSIGPAAHEILNSHLVGIPEVNVVTRDKLRSVLLEHRIHNKMPVSARRNPSPASWRRGHIARDHQLQEIRYGCITHDSGTGRRVPASLDAHPCYIKVSTCVRYRRADLDAWLEAKTRRSTFDRD